MTAITVVGIDCSATEGKTGLARAVFEDGALRIEEVRTDNRKDKVLSIVVGWLSSTRPALIALDAPLGWPREMRNSLDGHRAGQVLAVAPDDLFLRVTDREIQSRFKLRPFSVGADRIARTAHAAVKLLDAIQSSIALPVSLAWDPAEVLGVHAIEVYPSATRLGREGFEGVVDLAREEALAGAAFQDYNSHKKDACTCLIAAQDFLNGRALGPTADQSALAEIEGWIWAPKGERRETV